MLVDLHTHILPGVDDGAETIEQSLALLEAERQNGVEAVVFTPHFLPQNETPERFLKRRDEAFQFLLSRAPTDLKYLCGAEVLYSQYLANLEDLPKLCIGDTDYLLLELPYQAPFTDKLFSAIWRIVDEYAITPIIAHVERYAAVQKDPELLLQFKEMGCHIQINASTMIRREMRQIAKRIVRTGTVDLLASDCHDTEFRAPNLKAGFEAAQKHFDTHFVHLMQYTAQTIFEDREWESWN